MANGVYIDNATLPECCGECFAYDECGCRFISNVDKLHHKIWEKRAKECPLHACRPEPKVYGTGETTLDGSKSITLVFGICKQCGKYTPYANYCLNCGAKIRYGGGV